MLPRAAFDYFSDQGVFVSSEVDGDPFPKKMLISLGLES